MRVSTIPTIYGEKVVMRILDAAAVSHDLNRLGIEPTALIELKSILSRPHGIIIVTGPTGSGKSTTLYAALNHLKSPGINITTVEDPVEYRLAGINQIQVKPEIGLDFGLCLRAILRQDPDIILIGEIRDKETVEIAIKASLTGHLVLSTFHTNDAPSAISRLTYMGIERYLLASTLNLIVAQRLVRKICENCKEPVELTDDVLRSMRIDRERRGRGDVLPGQRLLRLRQHGLPRQTSDLRVPRRGCGHRRTNHRRPERGTDQGRRAPQGLRRSSGKRSTSRLPGPDHRRRGDQSGVDG